MRNDRTQSQRSRPLQLPCEALDAARAQNGIGRGEIDEIAVVRHDRFEPMTRDGILEAPDMLVRERGLSPLIRRLGKELDGLRAQLGAALGGGCVTAPTRHMRAQHHSSSVKASREMSGTNRTPPI